MAAVAEPTPSIPSHITPQVLQDAKTQLRDEGWCVIPNLIDAEKTKEVLDRLWKAAEESERRGDTTYMPMLDPNASNVRVFYLLELDAIFRELIQHPTAIEMVESVLGTDFLISNFTAKYALHTPSSP